MAGKPRPAAGLRGAARPEHWSAASRDDDVVHLDIPAHASRERCFEVFCSFVVTPHAAGAGTHGLRVLVDGAQEWARRVPTHPGGRDSLDFRFRRTVPIGRPLRITA